MNPRAIGFCVMKKTRTQILSICFLFSTKFLNFRRLVPLSYDTYIKPLGNCKRTVQSIEGNYFLYCR